MHIFSGLLFILSGLLALCVQAKSSTGDSILVVVEPSRKDDFKLFFNSLSDTGYELTYRGPKEESPVIIQDDVAQFDHVLLLSEAKIVGQDITPQSLVQLLVSGTNVIFSLTQKASILNALAAEFSLVLPAPGTPLISYFPEREEPSNILPIDILSSSTIPIATTAPVWFSGTPFALGNNPQLFPILNAPAESFAADTDSGSDALVEASEKGGEGLWAGSQLAVVAGFQLSGGARAAWVGGSELFSDAFAQKTVKDIASGNAQFATDLAAWTFQESNVLRIDSTTHHHVNSTEPAEYYTTNDQVVYTAHISKWSPTSAEWQPYSGVDDLQLEFTMLDPHIRTALSPVAGEPGVYSITFRAPDRHGVFKFVLNHKRKGLSHLLASTTVPVVPPRHDGYPRFLSAAWPYYTGAISTSIGFILFSAMWLAGDVTSKKGKGKVE